MLVFLIEPVLFLGFFRLLGLTFLFLLFLFLGLCVFPIRLVGSRLRLFSDEHNLALVLRPLDAAEQSVIVNLGALVRDLSALDEATNIIAPDFNE